MSCRVVCVSHGVSPLTEPEKMKSQQQKDTTLEMMDVVCKSEGVCESDDI